MRVTNSTGFSLDLIREIIREVRPNGIGCFSVTVRNRTHGHFSGTAHCYNPGRIVVSVGPESHFPCNGWDPNRGGYLPVPALYSRTEALVYVTAHELRHLWQFYVPRGWRVWGAKGRYSERDCDAFALKMLRKWRRSHWAVDRMGLSLPRPRPLFELVNAGRWPRDVDKLRDAMAEMRILPVRVAARPAPRIDLPATAERPAITYSPPDPYAPYWEKDLGPQLGPVDRRLDIMRARSET